MTTVRLGLLGCGTVGSSLMQILNTQLSSISQRYGIAFEVAAISVTDISKLRPESVPTQLLTTDSSEIISRDDIHVIVEVMGGTSPARELVLEALRSGKQVVTANKELLARHGEEVFATAQANGMEVRFEAAVAGGIPLVRPLRVSLAGETIQTILGIVNGTTNFILTQMADHKTSYEDALAEAQRLGYAESDPTADVEGQDAAAKAAILASLAAGATVNMEDVYCEGITGLRADDFEAARQLGYEIKLLAIIDRSANHQSATGQPADDLTADNLPSNNANDANNTINNTINNTANNTTNNTANNTAADDIAVRVHPTLLPVDHPLATVRDAFNAVFVKGSAVGELMFYGPGAGGLPTASAVLGDLIDAGRDVLAASSPAASRHSATSTSASRSSAVISPHSASRSSAVISPVAHVRPIEDLETSYFLSVEVIDRPGVLASVASVFGDHNVSIRWMEQGGLAEDAILRFLTHRAKEKDMQTAMNKLRSLEVVRRADTVIRVIE